MAALGLAFVLPAGAQTTSTLSGKLVDIITYVTQDHNMSAMKGDHAMAGGDHAMAGDDHAMTADHAMAGDDHAMTADHAMAMAPASCPALGVVSSKGKVTLVSAKAGSATAADLCKKLNADVTLTGTLYTQAGTTVFVVSSAN
jgi:hypothetical protein